MCLFYPPPFLNLVKGLTIASKDLINLFFPFCFLLANSAHVCIWWFPSNYLLLRCMLIFTVVLYSRTRDSHL